MRYIELTEGRDAPLYHGTSFYGILSILHEDVIYPSWGVDDFDRAGVRTSRSYNIAHTFTEKEGVGAVIELDQRKLAQRYKIVPYTDQSIGAVRMFGHSEYEEVIIGEIRPAHQYITKIFVPENFFDYTANEIDYLVNNELLGYTSELIHELLDELKHYPNLVVTK